MVNEMRDINTPLLKDFIKESREYLDEMETFMLSNLSNALVPWVSLINTNQSRYLSTFSPLIE